MNNTHINKNGREVWQRTDASSFWNEVASKDYVLQIYQNEDVFLDTLIGFVGTGINAGDCILVIAKTKHLNALTDKLKKLAVKPDTLIADDRYIPVQAEALLPSLLDNGDVDEQKFRSLISTHVKKARQRKRRIRVFGELVNLLCEQGKPETAVKLEHLWNNIGKEESLNVYCAYPEQTLQQHADTGKGIKAGIYKYPTKMIDGNRKQIRQVYYKDINVEANPALPLQ